MVLGPSFIRRSPERQFSPLVFARTILRTIWGRACVCVGGGSFTPSTPLVDFAVRLFEARHGGMGKCGSPANKIQGLVRIHVEFFRTDITLPRHLRLITSTTELKASIRRIQATVTLVIAWACACPRHTTHRIRNFGLYRRASEGFLAPNCPVFSHQVCEVARR